MPRRVRSAQERAIKTHEQLPPGKLQKEKGQEDLRRELLITNRTFYTAFFGFGRTCSWEVRTEITVIDALCSHHREDKIDDPLKSIDAEGRDLSFELSGQFARLSEGGSRDGHNS